MSIASSSENHRFSNVLLHRRCLPALPGWIHMFEIQLSPQKSSTGVAHNPRMPAIDSWTKIRFLVFFANFWHLKNPVNGKTTHKDYPIQECFLQFPKIVLQEEMWSGVWKENMHFLWKIKNTKKVMPSNTFDTFSGLLFIRKKKLQLMFYFAWELWQPDRPTFAKLRSGKKGWEI